jgi:hypothetical protein
MKKVALRAGSSTSETDVVAAADATILSERARLREACLAEQGFDAFGLMEGEAMACDSAEFAHLGCAAEAER